MASHLLIDGPGAAGPLHELFSDEAVLGAMLEVESALARASAVAGAIPAAAADAIARVAAEGLAEDLETIVREAGMSATPAVPFVAALRRRVHQADPDAAAFVHWGATSQDITDTAFALLLGRGRPLVAREQARIDESLRRLSEAHARTVMLGRTLLQPATPITFGLKAAGWHASAAGAWERLDAAWQAVLAARFGGASGTRAAAGTAGAAIARELAGGLGLDAAPPGGADRDRQGAFVAALALYTAALGKSARDIMLLMQPEIAEVSGPGGGSSTMPHKENPAGCVLVAAAATRLPGLAASFLGGMLQEHERGAGGLQAEWPTVAAAVQAAGGAAAAFAGVLDGLTVDAQRMRQNLEATGGLIFAERALLRLAPALGYDRARGIVTAAVQRVREAGGRFADRLAENAAVVDIMSPDELEALERPEDYLGDAEPIRRELLARRGDRPGG